MHEISLVQSLIENLENLRKEHMAQKITNITVIIGRLSGVVIDSFNFAFDALKKEFESLKNANLIIEIPTNDTYCPVCNFIYNQNNLRTNFFVCEQCGAPLISSGDNDIILKQVEME